MHASFFCVGLLKYYSTSIVENETPVSLRISEHEIRHGLCQKIFSLSRGPPGCAGADTATAPTATAWRQHRAQRSVALFSHRTRRERRRAALPARRARALVAILESACDGGARGVSTARAPAYLDCGRLSPTLRAAPASGDAPAMAATWRAGLCCAEWSV